MFIRLLNPAPQSLPTLRENKELEGKVTMKINKIESFKIFHKVRRVCEARLK